MNPVLKQISKARLSPLEIADLIRKHIGDGSSELHCEQALEALGRIRDDYVRCGVLVGDLFTAANKSARERIEAAIVQLRGLELGRDSQDNVHR